MRSSAATLLAQVNQWPIWRTEIPVWAGRFASPSLDRSLYLYLHRWKLMGAGDRATFSRRIRPGMRVVDVGANLGLYTVLFSKLAGERGKVFAFEPEPLLFEYLRRNCDINGASNVIPYNVALGAENGTVVLSNSPLNSGDNRLSARPWAVSRAVAISRLDDLLAGEHIDFLKMDTQGWEFHVVQGMRSILRRSRELTIYFEFWPHGLRQAGSDPQQLLEALAASSFSLYRVAGEREELIEDARALRPGRSGYMNLLAVRG